MRRWSRTPQLYRMSLNVDVRLKMKMFCLYVLATIYWLHRKKISMKKYKTCPDQKKFSDSRKFWVKNKIYIFIYLFLRNHLEKGKYGRRESPPYTSGGDFFKLLKCFFLKRITRHSTQFSCIL